MMYRIKEAKENQRFSIWTEKRGYSIPLGENIVIDDMIYEVIPHSKNGRDLSYETIEEAEEFVMKHKEEIFRILNDDEDDYIGRLYIKVFAPSELKRRN